MYQLLILTLLLESKAFGSYTTNKYHFSYLIAASALAAGFIAHDDNQFVYGGLRGRQSRRQDMDIRFTIEILRYRF